MPTAGSNADLVLLELATENAGLRQHLAEAQDLLIEMAVDAGALHAEIGALRTQLAMTERVRDAWRAEVERAARRAVA